MKGGLIQGYRPVIDDFGRGGGDVRVRVRKEKGIREVLRHVCAINGQRRARAVGEVAPYNPIIQSYRAVIDKLVGVQKAESVAVRGGGGEGSVVDECGRKCPRIQPPNVNRPDAGDGGTGL